MKYLDTILEGDCLETLKTLPDGCVNTCVTSPPYYGLRDYGHDDQIGLEQTPQAYVDKLVSVFREVKRVLRDDGTLWLNLGDSYSYSGAKGSGGTKGKQSTNKGSYFKDIADNGRAVNGVEPKNLLGIPWRVAFALQQDGWYLRQDIIWHKPNPMPESVEDRCTKAHEYIFLLSKSPRYYYNGDAIKEKAIYADDMGRERNGRTMNMTAKTDPRAGMGRISYGGKRNGNNGEGQESFVSIPEKRNKRSVWTVTTKPCSLAHFATFPEDLILPCILAGCPQGGVVIDPFMGAGTTGLVAKKKRLSLYRV